MYIHAILNLCMCTCMHLCIVHACMKKYTVLYGMLTSVLHRAVRSIACELYVVQRSVSRVTLTHFCRPIYRNLDLYDCCAKD